jgi:hypothetical protein
MRRDIAGEPSSSACSIFALSDHHAIRLPPLTISLMVWALAYPLGGDTLGRIEGRFWLSRKVSPAIDVKRFSHNLPVDDEADPFHLPLRQLSPSR